MKYLICQEWKNTKGNHAGMVHLCKLITNKNPTDYKLIIVPDIIIYNLPKIIVGIQLKLQPCIYHLFYFFISLKLLFSIKRGDSVFLFEYLLKERNQYLLARFLRFFSGRKLKIYGLTHLTPSRLALLFNKEELLKYSYVLDYNITLGTSLTKYLVSKGIEENKLITTFHYVDSAFYFPKKSIRADKDFTVIVMGIQMRDFNMLLNIVTKNPSIQFVICLAFFKMESLFKGYNNVTLKGFMEESQFKQEIEMADVSLNLMIDTVGSNVITTSMAMGLAMIVSNVGSIKDYCDSKNTIFCNNEQEIIEAIQTLRDDEKLLLSMKKSSFEKSKKFNFENFYRFFHRI